MREQPHYTIILTKEFFEKHYVQERKSMDEISLMLKEQGFNIVRSTLVKYCDRVGVPRRDSSEARRTLDWSISFEDENLIEWLDGFALGDGGLRPIGNSHAARATCTQEHREFAVYQMSGFEKYKPACAKIECKKSKNGKPGFYWNGKTKSHPDLYKHYLRWYPEGPKEPPSDVRITPRSVMLWYLGDGSIVDDEDNSIRLRLSTDGFNPKGVEFLASKLQEKGIVCHRNNDNRIWIEARGISKFFEFIGKESPVKCYEYKFNLPEWRLESKRMLDVADELKIDYQHLAYLVKKGKVVAYRVSEKGLPRFMPEHVEALRKMIATGEFDKDHRL